MNSSKSVEASPAACSQVGDHTPDNSGRLVKWHANNQRMSGSFIQPHLPFIVQVAPGDLRASGGSTSSTVIYRKEEAPWNNKPRLLISETSLGPLTDCTGPGQWGSWLRGADWPVGDTRVRQGPEGESLRGHSAKFGSARQWKHVETRMHDFCVCLSPHEQNRHSLLTCIDRFIYSAPEYPNTFNFYTANI